MGLEELRKVGGDSPLNTSLLRAFSVMLSQAVAPGKPKKPKKENQADHILPHAEYLYEVLRNKCGPWIISQPKSKAWIPALRQAIADLEDYSQEDAHRLVSWLHTNPLKSWPVPPNVGHCAKHLATFVGQARKHACVGLGRASPFAGALPKKP